MERIVIIDHDAHQLYIDDIDEDWLEEEYNGEEEEYIRDNYNLTGNYSWEYIIGSIRHYDDESKTYEDIDL